MAKGRSIWFVRHAQSEYNEKKLFTGWHNPNLTEHGIKKAHELKAEFID
ncbi:MAG: phosphoglycerate mutase family protein, partial [Pseudomonadota bacterium]|nr:phosphoglycerate mutase family protein [Pseudomonadota bacterium]